MSQPSPQSAQPGRPAGMNETRFFAEDARRRSSAEVEYGAVWRAPGGSDAWRVAYLTQTGELFLARTDSYPDSTTELRQLAVLASEREADALLDGWQAECGRPGSLAWLDSRLEQRSAAA